MWSKMKNLSDLDLRPKKKKKVEKLSSVSRGASLMFRVQFFDYFTEFRGASASQI